MSALLQYIKLSRPYNALLPVVAILAGFTIGGAIDFNRLGLTILIYVVLHGVITIWNDFEDEKSDAFNGIHRIKKVRQDGTYQLYIRVNAVLIVASLIAGFWLPEPGPWLIVLLIICGWLYNSKPVQLSRRPIGSMVMMFLFYGFIPFALGVNLGTWSWQALVLGIGWATGRLSLSILKDYKDAAGDARAEKKTFLLVYGGKLTARVSFVCLVLSLVTTICIVANVGIGKNLGLILIAAAWLVYERLQLFRRKEYKGLHIVFRDGLRNQLAFDILVVACLRIS